MLEGGDVHVVGRVDFQAVAGRNLAYGFDLLAQLAFAKRSIAQGGRFDAVQRVPRERAVVEVGVIGAEGNAVGIELGGLAFGIQHGVAFGLDNKAFHRFGGRVAGQQTARLQGFQVGYDQGPRARFGEVGVAVLQVDAHVVKVGFARGHARRKRNGEEYLAGFRVGFHQLGAAGHGALKIGRSGVEHPHHARFVGKHGLGANPVLEGLVFQRIVPLAPAGVGIGREGAVGADFGNGKYRAIVPARKTGEYLAAGRHGYAHQLRVGEFGHHLQRRASRCRASTNSGRITSGCNRNFGLALPRRAATQQQARNCQRRRKRTKKQHNRKRTGGGESATKNPSRQGWGLIIRPPGKLVEGGQGNLLGKVPTSGSPNRGRRVREPRIRSRGR